MQSADAVQKKRVLHWFHIPVLIIVTGFCIYWYFHVPLPNKAVLVLTGVTVVIALLEMHRGEKAIYLILVMCLMLIENRAINRDRAEVIKADDDRRREETTNFQAVLEGIKGTIETSQQLADATMARLSATLDRVGDSIKTQTGGDSFAYVTFVPQPNQQFVVAITSRGKYPLREIRVTMMDDERRLKAMQEYNQHPGGNWIAVINAADSVFQIPYLRPQSSEAPSGDVEMLANYPFSTKDENNLTIAFSSLNGYWNERLHLRRVNGKWHQALSVMGPTVKQSLHPFIYSDSDYPEGRALAEKDWARVKPQSQHP